MTFQASANTDYFQERHGNWDYLDIDSGIHPRIVYFKLDHPNFYSLSFDFLHDRTYTTELNTGNKSLSNQSLPSFGVDIPCYLRVDTGHIYKTKCKLQEEESSVRISFRKGLDTDFLKDCACGNVLRVKIYDEENTVYFHFELEGFAEAYRCVRSRINYDDLGDTIATDEEYFN